MGHVQGMETDWVSHSDRGSPVTANRLRSFPKAPGTMRGKLGPGDLQETARRLKTEIVLCKSTLEECSLCSVNKSFFLAQDLSILSLNSHQKWKSLLNGYQWILGFWGCSSRGNEPSSSAFAAGDALNNSCLQLCAGFASLCG